MTILDSIIEHKKEKVLLAQKETPLSLLKNTEYYQRTPYSLNKSFQSTNGIIAEFKRKSPSKGILHPNPDILKITQGYQKANVSALSVLTDSHFFGGQNEDIGNIRNKIIIPILRKDFILSEYQIHETKALGADVLLLIARCLSKEQIKEFTEIAHSIGLEVLLELNQIEEIDKIAPNIKHIGVNNRNLNTFEVDINNTKFIFDTIGNNYNKIAESGLSNPSTIRELKKENINGFLIGEHFMKQVNPEIACATFCKEL